MNVRIRQIGSYWYIELISTEEILAGDFATQAEARAYARKAGWRVVE